MRDKQRIDRMLNELGTYWKQNPDLRLGQMISNFADKNNKILFYLEDDDMEEIILDALSF